CTSHVRKKLCPHRDEKNIQTYAVIRDNGAAIDLSRVVLQEKDGRKRFLRFKISIEKEFTFKFSRHLTLGNAVEAAESSPKK
ncbi:MAG: hypothetical protein QOI13_2888, partial [Paraburkholderia sp.]|nr:hypothetical protein [Paraburkholderia sp.]